jgi:hypothetical protein
VAYGLTEKEMITYFNKFLNEVFKDGVTQVVKDAKTNKIIGVAAGTKIRPNEPDHEYTKEEGLYRFNAHYETLNALTAKFLDWYQAETGATFPKDSDSHFLTYTDMCILAGLEKGGTVNGKENTTIFNELVSRLEEKGKNDPNNLGYYANCTNIRSQVKFNELGFENITIDGIPIICNYVDHPVLNQVVDDERGVRFCSTIFKKSPHTHKPIHGTFHTMKLPEVKEYVYKQLPLQEIKKWVNEIANRPEKDRSLNMKHDQPILKKVWFKTLTVEEIKGKLGPLLPLRKSELSAEQLQDYTLLRAELDYKQHEKSAVTTQNLTSKTQHIQENHLVGASR